MVCSIRYSSSTKIVHLTRVDIDPFYGKVKYGTMLIHWISWKVLNVLVKKNGNKSCLNEYTKIYE